MQSIEISPVLDSFGVEVADPGNYDIVLADPPWSYYGSATKDAAAGKHYDLLSQEELAKLPILDVMAKKAALFLWATGPRLNYAIEMLDAWGLNYRGVAWVWAKTRKDGGLIHGQGVPPTFTKPTTEFLLAATTMKRGRAWPLATSRMAQFIEEPEGAAMYAPRQPRGHSAKPPVFHALIEELSGGNLKMLELFCRGKPRSGWHGWGNECG